TFLGRVSALSHSFLPSPRHPATARPAPSAPGRLNRGYHIRMGNGKQMRQISVITASTTIAGGRAPTRGYPPVTGQWQEHVRTRSGHVSWGGPVSSHVL